MNRAEFKDLVSDLCNAGIVVATWSLTQEVAGSSPFYCNDKYFIVLSELSETFRDNSTSKFKSENLRTG